MNIVIIGKSGQLAFELSRELENSDHQVTFLGRDDIDITNASDIDEKLVPLSADVLINASAYTAVDKADEEPDLAMTVNAIAPGLLAKAARKEVQLSLYSRPQREYVKQTIKTPKIAEEKTAP